MPIERHPTEISDPDSSEMSRSSKMRKVIETDFPEESERDVVTKWNVVPWNRNRTSAKNKRSLERIRI